MFKIEPKPSTIVFEDLYGLTSVDLPKPICTTVSLPALFQLHWTFYLFSKKLRVSQGLSTCCSFCLNSIPPTIFIDHSFASVSSLLKSYHLGELSPNPPILNKTVTHQQASFFYFALLLLIGAVAPNFQQCICLWFAPPSSTGMWSFMGAETWSVVFTTLSSIWGAVPGTWEAHKKMFVKKGKWMNKREAIQALTWGEKQRNVTWRRVGIP